MKKPLPYLYRKAQSISNNATDKPKNDEKRLNKLQRKSIIYYGIVSESREEFLRIRDLKKTKTRNVRKRFKFSFHQQIINF